MAGQFGATGTSGAHQAYAAGFPNPADLYLVNRVEVDPTSGEFLTDAAGNLIFVGSGILVREEQIDVLEFFPDPS